MKGYIFDYGGTLDTGGCHWGRFIWHAYERAALPVTWEDFSRAYVFTERALGSNPIIQTDYTFRKTLEIKLRIELEQLNIAPAAAEPLLDDLYNRVLEGTKHSISVLRRIKEPKALVSNFYGNLNVVLSEFGFDGLFVSVIESAVVGIRKPDPRIIQMGVDALGMQASDVTAVGDNIKKDILPARRLGCPTVWLRGEQWEPSVTEDTDVTIDNLEQLIN